jgi:CO/xanthine dehydrogenase Mo-binding subunit
VKILRIISSHDVGQILDPLGHQGQINGGVIQGIGFAMTEDSPLIDGHISTLSMADFKLMNIGDIPKLETILLHDDTGGPVPFKGKAIGELPNVPIAAAIANAVEDAIGVRILDLPITAEKVFAAIKAAATA